VNPTIIQGDCLTILPTLQEGSAHCCVTSGPYFGLRDYGVHPQQGHRDDEAVWANAENKSMTQKVNQTSEKPETA